MPETPKSPTAYERPPPRPVIIGGAAASLPLLAYSLIANMTLAEFLVSLAAIWVVTAEIIIRRDQDARIAKAIADFESATDSVTVLHALMKDELLRMTSVGNTLINIFERMFSNGE